MIVQNKAPTEIVYLVPDDLADGFSRAWLDQNPGGWIRCVHFSPVSISSLESIPTEYP